MNENTNVGLVVEWVICVFLFVLSTTIKLYRLLTSMSNVHAFMSSVYILRGCKKSRKRKRDTKKEKNSRDYDVHSWSHRVHGIAIMFIFQMTPKESTHDACRVVDELDYFSCIHMHEVESLSRSFVPFGACIMLYLSAQRQTILSYLYITYSNLDGT